ncbi:MAG TPA: tRNA epoxyqueuosine(34) reductase QueG [Gemmatimonas aurantiaca]|uniref:4Fe-4S ferredoxin-type domain-containing protein n=2 Tax=Gemmatimonas aurantiaca TaxID=173480 RepID=C1ABN3_GEMAT|nr:tRNA epoxyqueuosine(34) reductase QueG [Gemmatimonas aurantiaca]BAH39910.1 hypothetical protein GAU_2868 [Gemmatimonas aurantiaca T-27]HCT58079.1 tRNA epoxyqueuosine(34) reductase QueG [Gemmatimonas aurantiaca]
MSDVPPAARAAASAAAPTRSLSERLIAQAYGLGFDAAGIAELGEPETRAVFDAWLAAGHHGNMGYLDGAGAQLRHDSRRPHPGATHALVLAASYGGREPAGPVARYARGDDYHDVLRERMRELHRWLEQEVGAPIDARPYVDSAPILERDLAQRAGLGWFGKNTMLISPQAGSFLFLASLFVAFPLEASAPFEADRCGSCTRCIDACPTDAITAPRTVDARRCISYLTIELREEIPEALRPGIGSWLYGCDICQDVCPWNRRFAQPIRFDEFQTRPFLSDSDPRAMARSVLMMDAADYRETFRGSAMKRAKLWMLQRNAAVVLGNVGTPDDLPVLEAAAELHDQPLVREHATWAIRRVQERPEN